MTFETVLDEISPHKTSIGIDGMRGMSQEEIDIINEKEIQNMRGMSQEEIDAISERQFNSLRDMSEEEFNAYHNPIYQDNNIFDLITEIIPFLKNVLKGNNNE